MSEKLIPDAATSNPYPGWTQAYVTTEHYNEGWNACREEMLARLEVAAREQQAAQSHAEIAAAAIQACSSRTGADGWIFENTTQLQKFLDALK